MLNKKLIIKDGLAYEEDSDLPFTSSFKEFHANGALKKVSNYVDGKLHGLVQTYDRDGVPWQQQHWRKGEFDIDREDISQEIYDIDSLKILFSSSIRKQLSTCYISSGNTHLKKFKNIKLDDLKNEVREFLKNSENIRKIIEENHKRFLKEKGISNPERASTFYPNDKRKKRTTHCYDCKDPLNSFDDLSCKACKWILCSCGACGCGYMRY